MTTREVVIEEQMIQFARGEIVDQDDDRKFCLASMGCAWSLTILGLFIARFPFAGVVIVSIASLTVVITLSKFALYRWRRRQRRSRGYVSI